MQKNGTRVLLGSYFAFDKADLSENVAIGTLFAFYLRLKMPS
jgi:hypothetical protein